MRGWVITGTDTGVGKTLVAAALCALRHQLGAQPTYVKPVQSGADDGDDDAAVVAALAGVPAHSGPRLGAALAPAVAARLEQRTVTRDHLLAVVGEAGDGELVVEGAGGVLVELGTDGTTIADIAAALGLPVLVVCRPGLGTLNHSALTVEALQRRGVAVAGLVVCAVPEQPDLAVRTNARELRRIAPVVGAIPTLSVVDVSAAADWFAPTLGGRWDADRWEASLAPV